MVLLRPVEDGVDHIAPGHHPLAGKLVAAAAAVGKTAVLVLAEEIAGHGVVQRVFVAVHMVIHHIHHHADARRVQSGDHLLAFPDAHLAPGGVGGVAALRDVVVGGVVAPVVLAHQGLCLVHSAEIEDGHQLDILHPQPLEVVQAGGVDAVAVQGGVLLGKGHELAAPRRAHAAGGVLRKVPHAHLPYSPLAGRDHRAHIPLPAGRVGAAEVHDHAALPVDSRRPGVRVDGLAAHAVRCDRIGIVPAVLVAGQPDAPHALRAALHRQGAHGGAAVALAVEVHSHALGGGCPQPQPGAGEGVFLPQRAGIGGLPGKGVAFKQSLAFGGGCCAHIPSFLLTNFL